jgi:hypothetical protein
VLFNGTPTGVTLPFGVVGANGAFTHSQGLCGAGTTQYSIFLRGITAQGTTIESNTLPLPQCTN